MKLSTWETRGATETLSVQNSRGSIESCSKFGSGWFGAESVVPADSNSAQEFLLFVRESFSRRRVGKVRGILPGRQNSFRTLAREFAAYFSSIRRENGMVPRNSARHTKLV